MDRVADDDFIPDFWESLADPQPCDISHQLVCIIFIHSLELF
jgi:hypothetical protein